MGVKMNCPKCNADVNLKMNRCSECGQKLDVFNKIMQGSNAYYNVGLEQAKVRDLSGAVHSLKNSLKLNKYNTNARNLLALVYYEMGEVVSALSEWVISNNLQSEGNNATDYIDMIQSNPAKLEVINQTIRKYNAALSYAKQGNGDLAVIQLKKVTSLNPKFVRAGQLLGLLYMNSGDRGKAMRCLMQVKKVDVNNTLTLKYIEELHGSKTDMIAASDEDKRNPKIFHGEPVSSIMPVDSYKEEKPRVLPFINVLLGFLLGVLVMVVLFQLNPSNDKQLESQYSQKITEYGEQLASRDSRIASLENENKRLQEELDLYEGNASEEDSDESDANSVKEDSADSESYDALMRSQSLFNEKKETEAAQALLEVDEESLVSDESKQIYNTIRNATFENASKDLWEQGRDTYNKGNYEEAFPLLEAALNLNPDNVDAIYFMGRWYQKQNDKENAALYYNRVVDDFPDSNRASKARSYLRELGL